VVLVELDNVPTRWVRQLTLLVATINRKKEEKGLTILSNFVYKIGYGSWFTVCVMEEYG
jgi:hypothetical protein